MISSERLEGVFFCAFQGAWADFVRTARNNMNALKPKTKFFEPTRSFSNSLSRKKLPVAT